MPWKSNFSFWVYFLLSQFYVYQIYRIHSSVRVSKSVLAVAVKVFHEILVVLA